MMKKLGNVPLIFWTIPIAFALSGFPIGWFVGASATPVVATLIPLLFAVLGTLSYKLLRQGAYTEVVSRKIAAIELSDEDKKRVLQAFDIDQSEKWLPTVWSISLAAFFWCSVWGAQWGSVERLPRYAPLSELLSSAGIASGSLTSPELAILHRLRWKLQESGVPEGDAREAFQTIAVTLADESLIGRFNSDHNLSARDPKGRYLAVQNNVERLLYDLGARYIVTKSTNGSHSQSITLPPADPPGGTPSAIKDPWPKNMPRPEAQ